jgi:ribose 5-phosphate isomerase A
MIGEQQSEKKLAGEEAVKFIETGMIVGLGTGSTVRYTIEKLAQRIHNEGLEIKGVSTSTSTTALSEELGIPLLSLSDTDEIDVTIDGADEIDPQLNGIKGGGGALLFEKIVSATSKKNIWVADSGKIVSKLGAFPLPVEVVPFGFRQVYNTLKSERFNPVARETDGKRYVTDNGNWIIDLHLGKIHDPVALESRLNGLPGVVENGLFLNRVNTVITAKNGSIKTTVTSNN